MDALHAGDPLLLSRLESAQAFRTDGRLPLVDLYRVQACLFDDPHWRVHEAFVETITTLDGHALALPVNAFVTRATGPALWIIAGVHGEEPAGPNALAGHLGEIVALQKAGVPLVLLPLCNPIGYCRSWRYPDAERYSAENPGCSVGDSEHWLPDETGGARRPKAASRQCEALTRMVVELARSHPPRLSLDLHEDDMLERGYLYSQGPDGVNDPVGLRVIAELERKGFPIAKSGQTRFNERIVGGMIDPVRDGSVDELLAAAHIVCDGTLVPGPAGRSVLVVETGSKGMALPTRVAGHGHVLRILGELWELAGHACPGGATLG